MVRKAKVVHAVGHLVFAAAYLGLVFLAIRFHNYADLLPLACVGWAVLVVGLVFLLWSSKSRKQRQASATGTEEAAVVEEGPYAIVRHPEFVGLMLIACGLVFMAQHWAAVAVGALIVLFLSLAAIEEEARNLDKFGPSYAEYMRRVPRFDLVTGSIRAARRRNPSKGNLG